MLRVVVDPEVPADVADLMRRNGPLLSRYRAGWNPEPSGPRVPTAALIPLGALTVLTVLVTLVVGATGLFLAALSTVYLMVLACVYLARKPLPVDSVERVLYRHSRLYRGRFLVLEDFDVPSRALLGRVQQAIDRIMGSRVNALGMLDSVRNSVMLPAEEWEIARLLTKLSALRARHRHLARGGRTPEVAAAMAPLERALAASEAAVVARVEALERYARHVARADRALASRGQIDALLAHLPEYEQLVAETGAARFLAPEIGTLSEDAVRLQQALRDSVRSAHEAFRYLDG
ncbi:hypothetical protein [Streptosporangium pseudovulgare]|uniref:Uncharacterized protein n=1 Tax=Streptosporangium pseudovulgare TaxID=35765 RepID=A0ABQ2R466_9ACTN|nr:hypothetical protein [Streptosporangium pseudovulgare]GGQ07038.1 hypothetical protein GCM10010140_41550 [Streptosporangium pseudovulgare]